MACCARRTRKKPSSPRTASDASTRRAHACHVLGAVLPRFPHIEALTSVPQKIFLRPHLLKDTVYPEQYMDITTDKEG
jgi:hypothetical protein